MAVKNGRCPNCGSLIKVNDAENQAACMFCYAVFTPAQAITANLQPGDYTFPNEEQPEPDDEVRALAFSNYRNVHVDVQRTQPAPPKTTRLADSDKLTPAEKVALQHKDIVEPKMTKTNKIALPVIIGGLLVLLAVIFVPVTIDRENKRKELISRMNEIDTIQVPGEEHFDFDGFRNTSLLLISPEEVTEQDARDVLDNFAAIRAEVYGLDADVNQGLSLRLTGTDGAYLIDKNGELTQTK